MFRRAPVVDTQERAISGRGDVRGQFAVAVGRAEGVAAAVEEEDCVRGGGGEGADPFAGDAVVGWRGDGDVGVGDVGALRGRSVDLVVDGALDVDVVVRGEVADEGEEEGG